ncbi:MAG: HAMP domain-containing protein, partial [Alkalilacustris sp.]
MLDNIRISTRIAVGFGVIVALLLGLAGLTWTTATGLGGLFSAYRHEVATVHSAAELRNAMRTTQFALADFRSDPSADRAGQLEASIEALNGRVGVVRDLADSDAERRMVADIAASVDAFGALARTYKDLTENVGEGTDALTRLGIEHRRGIGELRAALEAREAIDLAYDALRASDAFLVTRVRIDRFFAGWPAEEFDTANAPFEQTAAALDRVARGILSADERRMLTEARAGIERFLDVATAARDAELARRPVADEIDAAANALVAGVEAAMARALEEQAAIGTAGTNRVAATQMTTLALSGAALLLAIVIAWVIGRSVGRSARGMVAAIGRIADGDLDTPVEGTQRRTEIGLMAKSLEVLRENARAAADERATNEALEAKRAEFFTHVGERVEALSQGRLDARVDGARWPDLDARTRALGDHLNALARSFEELIGQV